VQICVGSDAPEHAELVTVSAVQQASIDCGAAAATSWSTRRPPSTQQTLAAIDTADGACVVRSHVASMKAGATVSRSSPSCRSRPDGPSSWSTGPTQSDLRDGRVARFFNRRPDIVVPFTPAFDDAADRDGRSSCSIPRTPRQAAAQDLAARLTVLAPARR
jgi:hypothetical protein